MTHAPQHSKNPESFDREVLEYNEHEQEEIEKVIQDKCEVRFTLAHSAPIMTTLLGEKLRYLSSEEIARQIITGTYDIPDDLDPATATTINKNP